MATKKKNEEELKKAARRLQAVAPADRKYGSVKAYSKEEKAGQKLQSYVKQEPVQHKPAMVGSYNRVSSRDIFKALSSKQAFENAEQTKKARTDARKTALGMALQDNIRNGVTGNRSAMGTSAENLKAIKDIRAQQEEKAKRAAEGQREADRNKGSWKNVNGKVVWASANVGLPRTDGDNAWRAGNKALAPGAYGIDPEDYVKNMQAIDQYMALSKPKADTETQTFLDKYFGGKIPTADEFNEKYESLYNDASVPDEEVSYFFHNGADLVGKAEQQLTQYEEEEKKRRQPYEDAIAMFGLGAEQYAGKSDQEYYNRYGHTFGSKSMDDADVSRALGTDVWGNINPFRTMQNHQLTDEQREMYGTLYATYGEDAAEGYLQSLEEELNIKATGDVAGKTAKFASEHPVLGSALAVNNRIAGALGMGGLLAEELLTGNAPDEYDLRRLGTRMADTAVGTVGQKIEQDVGGFGGKALGFGYQTAMSLADMGANMLVFGPAGSVATSAAMGLSAASSAYNNAVDRGADHNTANAVAGVAGIAELLFEKFSIEGVWKIANGNGMKPAIKNIFRQIGIETSEETATEIANQIADYVLMGDLSIWKQEGPAAVAKEIGLAAAGGALMGAASGGGAQAYHALTSNAEKKNNVNKSKQLDESLVPEAQEQDPVMAAAEAYVDRERAEQDADLQIAGEEDDYLPDESEQETQAQRTVENETEGTGNTVQTASVEESKGVETKAVNKPENAENGYALNKPQNAVATSKSGQNVPVSVKGIDRVEKGKVYMRVADQTGNESVVSTENVDFAGDMGELINYENVKLMDARGVKAYLDGYDSSIASPEAYARAFVGVYERARTGLDVVRAVASSEIAGMFLTADAAQEAYMAGLARYNTENGVQVGTTRRMQESVINKLNELTGGKIRLTDADLGGANALFNKATGEILVSTKAEKGAYAYYAVHEVAHQMKANDKAHWEKFQSLVMDVLDNNGVDISAAMMHEAEKFDRNGMEYDDDALLEEVICNSAPAFLQDAEIVREMIAKDRTTMEKIADLLHDILDKMTSVLENLGADMSKLESWKGMQALKNDHEGLKAIYDCLMEGLESTQAQKQSQQDGSETNVLKLSAKENGDQEIEHIKDQLRAKKDDVNRLPVVASVWTEGKNGRSDAQLTKEVMDEYKASGYEVDRQGFGLVDFGEKAVDKAVHYANTDAEYAAILAAKKVVKRGIEIHAHDDHKNRRYSSTTFAAPVEVNGKKGIEAVLVKKTKGNRFTVARILAPDGTAFVFEHKKDAEPTTGGGRPATEAAAVYTPISPASGPIIKGKDGSVKMKNSLREDSDGVDIVNGSAVKYSLRSWTDEEKTKARKELVKSGYEQEAVDSWIDDVNSVAAIVASDKTRLDFEADPDQVMLKDNQEYYKTLDASTLCAKRLLYQGTFNAIQHRMPNTVMTSDRLLDLLNMMKDAGYETPCGICYVESRRRHLGKFAEQWLNGRPKTKEQKAWEPYSGDYIPSLDELTTTDGLAKLKAEHPQTYQDFVKKMSSLGSANPKIVELRTDYRGDIRKISKSTAEKIKRIGGLRVQSFSDFETPHMLDMMQAALDMTSKGLTSQAYTKVPNFAWVFGDTGIKINLSLIAEGNGLDENGNLIFSSSEGMDINEALRLRERYSQNVGTIIVGANDAHIKAAMADPRIDYIIPFHRSGWGQNELKKVGVLQEYTDYQASQNERTIEGYSKNGAPEYGKPEGGNFYPIDYWDYSKTGDQNAEIYLRMCEEDGRVPKFDQFLTRDEDGHWKAPSGYWKLLIDFKMYDNDGVGAPQETVKPKFNMTEARRVLEEYQGGANSLPVAQDIVDRFVAEVQKEEDGLDAVDDLPTEESNFKYSLREEEPPKKTIKGYKVFAVFPNKPGELYPPMVANPGGEATPVGVWLNADAAPRAEDSKTGRPKVQAGGKGTQASKQTLAYRPGWHLGDAPRASQFVRLNPETGKKELFPENFVWAECDVAADLDYQQEAMSYGYNANGKFQHSLAGLPRLPREEDGTAGYYRYRTNPNPDTVPWIISGAIKVNRILDDEETRAVLNAQKAEFMDSEEYAAMSDKEKEKALERFAYIPRKGGDIDLEAFGLHAGNVSNDDGLKFSLRETDETVQDGIATAEKLFTLTHGYHMTEKNSMTMARKVIDAASSTMAPKDLAPKIRDLYDYAERGKDISMEAFDSMKNALAEEVMATSQTLDTAHEERMQPIRDYFRNNRISFSDQQNREAAGLTGSLGAYRRMVFGRVRLTMDGTPLDTAWGELNELDSSLFPADASDTEQVQLLLDAVDAMAPVYQNQSGMNALEANQWLALEMDRQYFALAGVQAAAKEQDKLAVTLKQYRDVTKRFQKNYKAVFDEAMTKVKADMDEEKAKLLEQAEKQRKLDRMEAEADASAFAREQIAAVEAKSAEEMEAYREALKLKDKEWRENYRAKAKDTSRKQRYRAEIARMANDLVKKLEKPTDKKHIMAGLDEAVLEFMQSIELGGRNKTTRDLSGRIAKLTKALEDAKKGTENGAERQYLIDADLFEDLAILTKEVEGLGSMNKLNADQMRDMRDAVKAVTHIVNNADRMFTMQKNVTTGQVAQRSIEEMRQKKDKKQRDGFVGMVDEMVNDGMLDSFRFFDRVGTTGREVFQGVRDGFDEKVRCVSEANDYVQEQTKKLDKDIVKGEKAKKTTYKVSGGSVELSKAQVMELYCLNKRDQARMHLYNGGIRTDKAADPVKISEADVKKITDALSGTERMVADALQLFMAKNCAEWGNQTSMTLYGYRKFGEKNYYPITVDKNSTQTMQTEAGQTENLYAILNMGMTKSLKEKAENALTIGDIFDTFSRHVDNMSTYRAYAAPIADMLRWYNWRPQEGSGVKTMLERKFGAKGRDYVSTLIRDLNGQNKAGYSTGIMETLTQKAKSSSVGANIRVAIQQPTAIARAADMMSPKFVQAGLTVSRRQMKEAIDLAQKYCPIAKWKSLGFYETHIGKGLRNMMFGGQPALETLTDKSMWLAGKMDEVTWGALWRACEKETQATMKDLKVGSEAYYQHVGKRLSEIIDYTQVVDTPLHRSQLMRSKNYGAQMITAFMSEPTKTYNMMYAAISRYAENRKDPVARAKVGRMLVVYTTTAALNAIAQSVWDAVRDDEEEEWFEKFQKALLGDYEDADSVGDYLKAVLNSNLFGGLNPLGMIPLANDILDMMQGYDPSRTDMQAIQKFIQLCQQVGKAWNGESDWSVYKWVRSFASTLSYVTGLPAENFIKEVASVVNTVKIALDGKPAFVMQHETATASYAYENMYDALLDGNTKTFNRIDGKLKADEESPKSNSDIDAGIGKLLAEDDERIVKAWEAKTAGKASEVQKIRQEIVKELAEKNVVSKERLNEIVDKAIVTYGNAHTEKEEEPFEPEKALKVRMYTVKDMAQAVRGVSDGTTSETDAKTILSELVADSEAKEPEKSVISDVQSELKKDYLAYVEAGDTKKADKLAKTMQKVLGTTEDKIAKWVVEAYKKEYVSAVKNGNSTTASKLANKLKTYGGAKKEDMDEWVADSYRDDLRTSVDANNATDARKIVTKLRAMGYDDSNIKSSLSKYKELYVEAMKKKDYATASKIKSMLKSLGLKGKKGDALYTDKTFTDWLK